MKDSRGDALRELYLFSIDDARKAMEAAETLGFAYTLESYTRITSEDEGQAEYRLTLYGYGEMPQEEAG